MKKNLILLGVLFILVGVTSLYAQCCKPTANKAQTESAGQQQGEILKLKITGITCAGCSNRIANALKAVNGIIEQKVEYPGDLATITYDPAKTNAEAISKVIEETGFKVERINESQKKKS